MTIDFPLTISRTRPIDHEAEVHVTAKIERVAGEPGSSAIQAGWSIVECGAVDENGNEVDDEQAQRQIEEAVMERVGRLA